MNCFFANTLILLTALGLVACASSRATDGKTGSHDSQSLPDLPEWVDKVPGACAVGSTKYRNNPSMARTTALARARAELSRSLETRVQTMIKDYQAQGEVAGKDFTEERVVQVSRQLSDQAIPGTRMVANFLTKTEPQELYALVCIDPGAFVEAISNMNVLSEAARTALKARAEAELKDMDDELSKLRGSEQPQ